MVMISELMIITIVIGGHIISAPAEIFFIVKMHRQLSSIMFVFQFHFSLTCQLNDTGVEV